MVKIEMSLLRKKSVFRFSLRGLLVSTTILGVLLGLVGNEARRLRLHRQAERKVRELGGWYGSLTGGEHDGCWGPPWCPVIRDRIYADSTYVWFNSTRNAGLRDNDLEILKHFPGLKDLQISAPLITDEAMIHLEGINSLRELTLYRTQVSSRGLRHLGRIPLEMLMLGGPDVTDETLEALEVFPELRKLWIAESSVTDMGLANLAHVPHLEKLILHDSPICDSGMHQLARLTRLYEADLRGIAITDDGIVPLASVPKLSFLNVAETHVTETGLLMLRNRRTLKYLNTGQPISCDTFTTLTAALPDCQVYEGGGWRCMQGW